jgi:hypothetical protein
MKRLVETGLTPPPEIARPKGKVADWRMALWSAKAGEWVKVTTESELQAQALQRSVQGSMRRFGGWEVLTRRDGAVLWVQCVTRPPAE